jgi:putative DNA methylase
MLWDYSKCTLYCTRADGLRLQNVSEVQSIEHFTNGLGEWIGQNTKQQAVHGSATDLPWGDDFFDAVITDPPYYDNVNYSNLSDFFYVWLKRTVGHLHPDLFATPLTPKSQEMVADAYRFDGREGAKQHFEAMLLQSFREIRRVLKPDGIAVIVFAHKTTEAWETVLGALTEAGLRTTMAWPIHTEMQARLLAQESAALASSIYIVCRKRQGAATGYWSEVRRETRELVERRLQRFWDAGVRGADMFISAIGAAMEVFTRYARVEKASGDPVSMGEFLQEVRQVVAEFALRRVLHEQAVASELDALTRFYLLYRWAYGRAEVPFDEARKLATSVGLELTQAWGAGEVVQQDKERVRVLAHYERAWGVRPGAKGGRGRPPRSRRRAIRAALAGGDADTQRGERGSHRGVGRAARPRAQVADRGDSARRRAVGGEPNQPSARVAWRGLCGPSRLLAHSTGDFGDAARRRPRTARTARTTCTSGKMTGGGNHAGMVRGD